MRKFIKDIILLLFQYRRYNQKRKKEIRNIKNKKNIYNRIILSQIEKQEISDYFINNYGRKFSDKWHKLYQSYTGKYDKRYFPEILYSTLLEEKLNPKGIADFIEDKSFVELLYKNVSKLRIPKTIVINCSGIYYDGNRKIISYDDAILKLCDTKEIVFKTTIDSCSGKSIRICQFKDGIDIKTGDSIREIIKIYNKDFIIQECITNCKELRKLHPDSINTFRVMTYIVNDKIYHAPIILRIGQGNKRVDNAHAGGMFIGVTDDGNLLEKAFTEYADEYIKHPDTNVYFKDYHIPKVTEMIDIAYICHGLTPHLGIVSWDFTVDDSNCVTLIEINTTGQSIWLSQIAHGCGIFGDNTEEMYKIINK